jgi:hypothetical protein
MGRLAVALTVGAILLVHWLFGVAGDCAIASEPCTSLVMAGFALVALVWGAG